MRKREFVPSYFYFFSLHFFAIPLFLFFLSFSFPFGGCGKGKQSEIGFDDFVILEGKRYSIPLSRLPTSIFIYSFLSGFQKVVSEVTFSSLRIFPQDISSQEELISHLFSDLYSFFLPDNLFLARSYCDVLTCPFVSCGADKAGNSFSFKMNVKGNCFNDVFSFSGEENMIFSFESEFGGRNSYKISYQVAFDRWNFKGVETGEYVSYSGDISFIAISSESGNFANRKINVRGISRIQEIGSDGRNQTSIYDNDFRQNFSVSVTGDAIRYELSELQNPFCFAHVKDLEYKFRCHRSFKVKNFELSESQDVISFSGNFFETIPFGGKLIWFSAEFSLKMYLDNRRCVRLFGDITILSDEKLHLHFDRDYGDRGCDFTCPSEWSLYDKEGNLIYSDINCLSY